MADVYYSVGTSTSDLKTGSPNVSITSGVATFDTAQTGNIGVGDVVVANSISYIIVSKVSTSVWGVRNLNGTAASDVGSTAVTSIKRAFNSLADALDTATPGAANATHLNTLGLVVAAINLFIACYADGNDASLNTVDAGWTTNATYHLTIFTPTNTSTECNTNQRHNGVVNGGGYTLKSTAATENKYNLNINADYTKIFGIKVVRTSSNWSYGFCMGTVGSNGNNCEFAYNLLYQESGGGDGYLMYNGDIDASVHYACSIHDNIMINDSSALYGLVIYGGYQTASARQCRAYNNTVYGSFALGAVRVNIADSSGSSYLPLVKNNYAVCTGAGADYSFANDYDNTKSVFAYNGSDDGTAGISNSNKTIAKTTCLFINETAGTQNLHIQLGSNLIDKGISVVDDSFVSMLDIDANSRSGNASTLGADELASICYSVGTSTSDLKTGSPNVSIVSGKATFDAAQTGNIGIGDVVLANSISYTITGKISTTVWGVRNINNTAPSDIGSTAVTSIKRAFNSLAAALDTVTPGAADATHLNTLNLVTAAVRLMIACYADGNDASMVKIPSATWTTSASYYIFIFTPKTVIDASCPGVANQNQRHDGKINGTGYLLKSTNSGANLANLSNMANYTKVYGLKIWRTSTNDSYGIGLGNNYATDTGYGAMDCEYAYNLLYQESGGDGWSYNALMMFGQTSYYRNANLSVHDNILVSDSSGAGFLQILYIQGGYLDVVSKYYHIYNNTVYGKSKVGAIKVDVDSTADVSTILVKNNYAVNTGDGADYHFGTSVYNNTKAGFAYNGSDDGTAGASNNNKTITKSTCLFTNEAAGTQDMHVRVGSSLLGQGVGLASDTNVSTLDIDANIRNGGVCALGADELPVMCYSVGTSTADLKTGSPNITIVSGKATFDAAQTNVAMGIGDIILANGVSYSIVSKISTSIWNVRNINGTVASDIGSTAVTSIKRAFNSLNAAMNSATPGAANASHLNTMSLTSFPFALFIACYADGADDNGRIQITGWTTSSTCRIKIFTPNNTTTQCNQTQRHAGTWATGYLCTCTTTDGFYQIEPYSQNNVTIEGLRVTGTSYATSGIILYICTNCIVEDNIVKGLAAIGIQDFYSSGGNYIINNIVYDCNNCGIKIGNEAYSSGQIDYVYNNTVVGNGTYGIYLWRYGSGTTYSAVLKNNICQDNTSGDYGAAATSGTSTYNLYNCISKDSTSDNFGGSGNIVDTTLTFVNKAGKDFHLASSDTAAINAGLDLHADANYAFNTDINGNARPDGAWDIGADEIVSVTQTGSGADSPPAATSAGTGNRIHVGTGANVPSAATSVGVGVRGHPGIGANSPPEATSSGIGGRGHAGSGNQLSSASTSSGSGILGHSGSGADSSSQSTSSGSGIRGHSGSGSQLPASCQSSGSAGHGCSGSGPQSSSASISSGSGVRGHTGSGSQSPDSCQSNGIAETGCVGSGGQSPPSATSSGSGSRILIGSGNCVPLLSLCVGSGSRSIIGSGICVPSNSISQGLGLRWHIFYGYAESFDGGFDDGFGTPILQSPEPAYTSSIGGSGNFGVGSSFAPAAQSSGVGIREHIGSGNQSPDAATSSGLGSIIKVGSGNQSPESSTSIGSGARGHAGSGSQSPGGSGSSGSGSSGNEGSGSQSPEAATSIGAGSRGHIGSGSQFPEESGSSGSGSSGNSGSGGQSPEAATSSGYGVKGHVGSGDQLSETAISSGYGIRIHVGSGNQSPEAATSSGSGTIGISGFGSQLPGFSTTTGTGVRGHTGSGPQSPQESGSSGSGETGNDGSGSQSPPAAISSGYGVVGHESLSVATPPESQSSGSGFISHTGSGLQAPFNSETSSIGVRGHDGSGGQSPNGSQSSGSGSSGNDGTGSQVPPNSETIGSGARGHDTSSNQSPDAPASLGDGYISHVGSGDQFPNNSESSGFGTIGHTGSGSQSPNECQSSGFGSSGDEGVGNQSPLNAKTDGSGSRGHESFNDEQPPETTSSGNGSVGRPSSSTAIPPASESYGFGIIFHIGYGDETDENAITDGSGSIGHTGYGPQTTNPSETSGSGESGVSGYGPQTPLAAESSGFGTASHVGLGDQNPSGAESSGSGESSNIGQGQCVPLNSECIGYGTRKVVGSGQCIPLNSECIGYGSLTINGSGGCIPFPSECQGIGERRHIGSGDQTCGQPWTDGSGESSNIGSGNSICPYAETSGYGEITRYGSGDQRPPEVILYGRGLKGYDGIGTCISGRCQASGSGTCVKYSNPSDERPPNAECIGFGHCRSFHAGKGKPIYVHGKLDSNFHAAGRLDSKVTLSGRTNYHG